MSELAPLTEAEIQKLAEDWYKGLDVHVTQTEIVQYLSSDGDLKMVFPEGEFNGLAEFEGWFQGVIRIFFDEVHTLQKVESTINGTEADVDVIVRWEASRWNPPAATSDRLRMDAYQTWKVKRADNGKVVITYYRVDDLKLLEGSAAL